MTDPTYPTATSTADKIFQILTTRIRRQLTEEGLHHAAQYLTVSTSRDPLTERTWIDLRTELAVEHLPATAHPFQVVGVQQYPVWATWRDHFKHQYQLRWWARWWVRRHPPQHRWTDVRVNQRITVPLRAAWKYPHVPVVPSSLGRTYLHTWTDPAAVTWSDGYDWNGDRDA